MNRKNEIKTLRSLRKILLRPDKGLAIYTRIMIGAYAAGALMLLISSYVLKENYLHSKWGLLLGVFSGMVIGVGTFYRIAKGQWQAVSPHINSGSVEKRISELET